MWDSDPVLPAASEADPQRAGRHGLEIVKAEQPISPSCARRSASASSHASSSAPPDTGRRRPPCTDDASRRTRGGGGRYVTEVATSVVPRCRAGRARPGSDCTARPGLHPARQRRPLLAPRLARCQLLDGAQGVPASARLATSTRTASQRHLKGSGEYPQIRGYSVVFSASTTGTPPRPPRPLM